MRRLAIFMIASLTGTLVFAHSGVTNPVVAARMSLMTDISTQTKLLSNITRGLTDYDPAQAEAAKAALAAYSSEIPDRFYDPATDPLSEARAAIWTEWPDFVARAEALTQATQALDTQSVTTLRQSFGPVAQSCIACHGDYTSLD